MKRTIKAWSILKDTGKLWLHSCPLILENKRKAMTCCSRDEQPVRVVITYDDGKKGTRK